MRRNEDLKGRGGGRLKHHNVDGDVPLCLRKIDEESKDGCSSNKKKAKKIITAEAAHRTARRMEAKSKMTSGSEELCGGTAEMKK